MSRHSWVEVRVSVVKKKTPAAVLVITYDGDEVWLPLSQLECDEIEEGETDITVSIPRWLADEKELT